MIKHSTKIEYISVLLYVIFLNVYKLPFLIILAHQSFILYDEMSTIQTHAQTLAYEQQRAFEILSKALEALEGYLAKTDRMINRPQIYGTSKWIKSDSGSSWDLQECFLIHLNICGITFSHRNTNFPTKQLVRQQFYTWLANLWKDIPAEQCPQDLAHFLIEIHDVLDGDKSKITKENIEYDASNNETQPSAEMYNDSFFDYQQQIHKVDLQKESLGNKTSSEVELQGKFSGGKEEEEKGKIIFEIIEKKYRKEHKAYPLFIPYDKRQQQSYLI
ncbi:uncharacterized protein OCT59_018286 [Rhizophagus irregularis]|nr:hypothetical protein OCT59_018286 [Rhizophagus irregularis]